MSTPTFDEVLASARQLSAEDQIRLRAALPVAADVEGPLGSGSGDSHAFRALAGVIDEPPQPNAGAEAQEIYGRPAPELRPGPTKRYLEDLPALLKEVPHLTEDEAARFAADLSAARASLNHSELGDPWQS